jgi:hypothetical protein
VDVALHQSIERGINQAMALQGIQTAESGRYYRDGIVAAVLGAFVTGVPGRFVVDVDMLGVQAFSQTLFD